MRVLPVRQLGAVAVTVAAACFASAAYVRASAERQSPPGATISADRHVLADMTFRRARFDGTERGAPERSPAMSFRLERRSGPNGVVAVMTLTGIERATAQSIGGKRTLARPPLAVRMEHDTRNGLRLYDARGRRLAVSGTLDRALFGRASDTVLPPANRGRNQPSPGGAPAWLENLVASPEDSNERRARLERSHGPRQGSVRGMHQYISLEQGDLNEVLVDPATALPLEMNTMRNGELIARAQMFYARQPSGLLVRKLLRAERIHQSDPSSRVVLEVELSNVRAGDGGAQ